MTNLSSPVHSASAHQALPTHCTRDGMGGGTQLELASPCRYLTSEEGTAEAKVRAAVCRVQRKEAPSALTLHLQDGEGQSAPP